MSYLAVDLGTSFLKGAVLDVDSLTLKHIQRVPCPAPVADLPALFFEVDPLQIAAAFRSLVEQLLPYAPDCQGLVMCSQMHGLVLTTTQGEALSNCITWQDQRALLPHPSGQGSYFEVLLNRLSIADQQQLGHELKPSLPLSSLFWLAEAGKLPSGDVIPTGLPDFVLAHLSSAIPNKLELTYAASLGALNLETMKWHRDVIEKLGLTSLNWPLIQSFGETVYSLDIGGESLPCYAAIGDHQCAVVGAFLGEGELSLNIGTASQVTTLTPQLQLGDYQTRPFFDGRFMNTISRLPAGRSLNVLVKLLSELADAEGIHFSDPWSYIAQATAAVSETELQVDLAFFTTTVGDRGHVANIQEDNLTVGHLFRAAFQNMAENYYGCAQRLSSGQTQNWRSLVFSGGVSQKLEVLRHIIRDRFEIDYRLCASEEDTLLGLLALALVVSGRADTVQDATKILLRGYDL